MEAPVVNVGIMTEKAISFVFHGEYVHTETGLFMRLLIIYIRTIHR